MRMLLCRLIGAALLGLTAIPLTAPACAQMPAPLQPRIVVQAVPPTGIEAATWSRDGGFVFTASGLTREVVIWDVAKGVIVDRVRLPATGTASEALQVRAMTLGADGRTLRIEGEAFDTSAADGRAGRAFALDVVTRKVTALPAPPVAPLRAGETLLTRAQGWMKALETLYEPDGTPAAADVAAATAALPALPPSPDGRWRMLRVAPGFALVASDGSQRRFALNRQVPGINDAALSPDGRTLALMHLNGDGEQTTVDIFDLLSGRLLRQHTLPGDHDRLHWLDATRFLVSAASADDDPRDAAEAGTPSPMVTVDAATGRVLATTPARCFVRPLRDGSLVGAGLANCRSRVGNDHQLVRLVAGKWAPLPGDALPDSVDVRDIAASPRGDRIAVLLRLEDGSMQVGIIRLDSGDFTGFPVDTSVDISTLGFSADGRRIWLAGASGVAEWLPDSPATADGKPAVRDFEARMLLPTAFANDSGQLLVSGAFEEQIARIDLATGKALPPLALAGATAVGFVPGKPLIWAAATMGGVRLWDSRTGRQVLATEFMADQGFVTVAPDGRYDTNLGPDSAAFRWVVPDAPFQSLAPQTFMRDYFTPRLTQKLTDCTTAGNCAAAMPPLPPISGLNRLLPSIRITGIEPAETPGQVVVHVEAQAARSGARGSGLYGLKLLLNGRQVEQVPGHFEQPPAPTLPEWREVNALELDAAGRWRGDLQISVPTHHDGQPMTVSAYAFNSDRVKSDTAQAEFTPPAVARRPRRAFVVTIGVDDYVEPRLQLNFAVADAAVIAGRLQQIPGYEMRHISLTSSRAPDGTPARQVTRADILGVLGFLSGFPPEMDQVIRLQDVHKIRGIEASQPDDIVIISFSGHGFADTSGKFAMIPSNARWPMGSAPAASTVLSADDLTIWLGFMAAAEIAVIIDACHSGAAVATPDFKPGPMGDPGLGQLAFDKGIRILAATQANDVALENARLGQGFLTYALGEGLTATGGPADLDGNGTVLLDEWLRYAVARLPSLTEQVRRGGGITLARGVLLEMVSPDVAPPAQQPSLFDFNPRPSPVVLRASR